MSRIRWSLCAVALAAAIVQATAQVNPYKDGTPGVTGYRSEVLAEVIVQENKFTRLAEAIPAEKYNWRPSPARSLRYFCTSAQPTTTSTSWLERLLPLG